MSFFSVSIYLSLVLGWNVNYRCVCNAMEQKEDDVDDEDNKKSIAKQKKIN